ncbi:hypothetical protein MFRU_010g02820 [Monilinia fructicola]|uniref:Rhodopsin domain-containing protein n=1 Tax=Monilinia fructicola TaxID=38448 RepID=A0A5M9JDZ8_MONFR|nr:hypothetical protein EYC84_008059 [Monilinia fructicola]KAG4031157.1 hypothetical protein MFRU_010g02820 [Monilinia fructicola]
MVSLLPDGVTTLVVAISFLVIDTIALILRAVSRIQTRSTTITGRLIRIDDWWILAAYLMYASHCVLIICDVVKISGTLEPFLVMDPHSRLNMVKLLWIGTIHFPFVITAVKISILCMYHSLFITNPNLIRCVTITMALCIAWFIVAVCLTVFGCTPIKAAYDIALRIQPATRCVSYGEIVLIFELPNALLDVVILALPFFVIRDLHVPVRKKVLLFLVFWFGGFVIVTCILRIVYSYQPHDPEHLTGFSTANEWLMIEEGSAILGACVPTFRPILKTYFKLPKTINDWLSSSINASATASKFSNAHLRNQKQTSQPKNKPGPSFKLQKLSTAYIHRGREGHNFGHDQYAESDDSPLVDNKIWVTRHVTTSG